MDCNKLPNFTTICKNVLNNICVWHFESEFVDVPNAENQHQFIKDLTLDTKMASWPQAFIWMLINIYYPKYVTVNNDNNISNISNNCNNSNICNNRNSNICDIDHIDHIDIFLSQFATDKLIHTEPTTNIPILDLYTTFKMWWIDNAFPKHCPSVKDMVKYFNQNGYKIEDKKLLEYTFLV